MRVLLCACAAGLLVGCGAPGVGAHSASALAAERARARELDGLRKRNAEQAARLRELETQLALAQAGLEELRTAQAPKETFKRETVRIGGDTQDADADPAAPAADPDPPASPDDDGPRPLLRLYGRAPPVADADDADIPVPEVPAGLPARLPVTPLPDAEVPAPSLLASAQAVTPPAGAATEEMRQDPGVQAYRMALTLVRDRQFAQAEQAFQSFLKRYPSHPYANHARYWLAEVLYALRKYPEALEAFGQVARQATERDRAAEAVLKMGLCEKRMGRRDQARALFEGVRKEYPGSVAARLALQEEAF